MTFSSLIVESQTGRLNLAKTALLDNPDTKADISLQPKLDHSRTVSNLGNIHIESLANLKPIKALTVRNVFGSEKNLNYLRT